MPAKLIASRKKWTFDLIYSVRVLVFSISTSVLFDQNFFDLFRGTLKCLGFTQYKYLFCLCPHTRNAFIFHKKGSKNDPNNYRPISLTAICFKIMERIIKRHIINFLVQNHIISDQQLGIVPGRSTTLQMLRAL